jgi:hypothetical protein
MTNIMSEASQGVYIRPARSIGGITMDVTVEETHVDELELTEHPVEQGAAVSDHAYLLPRKVTIRAGASDSGGDTPAEGRCVEIYRQLLELQGTREPFELVTGKRSYQSMQIKSLTETTDKDSGAIIMVTAELREVTVATVQVVAIPRSRQRNGHKTGGVDQRGQVQAEKREDVPESALFSGLGG